MTPETRSTSPDLPEKRRYLALLAAPAVIWSLHFLAAYITAAVWCADAPSRDAGLGPVRLAIVVYTAIALAATLFVAYGARGRHMHGGSEPPHDADTAEDRHRFLGFATLLLAGLAGVASIYLVMTVIFIGTCR
jgi:hypothetical protein